jgi:hypothetical protein
MSIVHRASRARCRSSAASREGCPARIRETVYVVGAGFSAGLGYPLTKGLLIEAWEKVPDGSRDQLRRIVQFHHPAFSVRRRTSFPGIEELLTEMAVNLELFKASRPAEGRFTEGQLRESQETLLFTIASWFHKIYKSAKKADWLSGFIARLRRENAAIISFNWDLVLDQLLFGGDVNSRTYGLSAKIADGPLLLKPHGSLNWYEGAQLGYVPDLKRTEIFHDTRPSRCVHAFLRPREVISKVGKRYTPFIVPPTFLKNFSRPISKRLWQHCTDVLSTPSRLVFLGYSLPPADLHAQFIFRCGFHNQINGRLRKNGTRYPATGPAEVIIVNPDQDAARRIEAVAGPEFTCNWIPQRVQDWVDFSSLSHR